MLKMPPAPTFWGGKWLPLKAFFTVGDHAIHFIPGSVPPIIKP